MKIEIANFEIEPKELDCILYGEQGVTNEINNKNDIIETLKNKVESLKSIYEQIDNTSEQYDLGDIINLVNAIIKNLE